MKITFPRTMTTIEYSRRIDLCISFVRYAFKCTREENDPTKNFDTIVQERYGGDTYDCITEYFCDIIYEAIEFSFEDYCNQHGGAFENCVEFLQDFVEMQTDVEFLTLCMDEFNNNENENENYVPDE
jgi:hypothetical protein